MLLFSKAKILTHTASNDEAIDLLLSRPRGKDFYPFYYLDFLTGLAKLHRLDSDADHYLLRFTANFRGRAYVKEAYQKLGWHALIQGHPDRYHDYMDKVLLYGNDFADGDKMALAEAKSEEMPNVCLLKARLLFDGGYYLEADSVLNNMMCLLEDVRDSIEYPYRKGRVAHEMGEADAALQWYDETITLGWDSHYYFAANAALKAGNICESELRYDRAEYYYRKCLNMPNREYRRSLQQKAKAGLNRIRDKKKAD